MKKELVHRVVFAIIFSVFLIQCKKEEVSMAVEEKPSANILPPQDSSPVKINDSIPDLPVVQPTATTYSAFIVSGDRKDSLLSAFKEKYSADQRSIILKINRLDNKNLHRADTLMIPKVFEANFLAYSPFPMRVALLGDVRKVVMFSYPVQAFAVYEFGTLVKWGPTSMGKKSAQTKQGLMFTNWKKELSISSVSDEWKLPYNVNIHNSLGIGWHQYDLPGYPASHSCLRLQKDDAQWLYGFAESWVLNPGGATTKAKGIPVIVFGEYAWGRRKPWKMLEQNPKATDISEEELNAEIRPYLDEILKEQANRELVLAELATVKKSDSLQ